VGRVAHQRQPASAVVTPEARGAGAPNPALSPTLNLPRIRPRVLRQEVLAALRAAILANEIPSGSRLLEAEIAARMGVSRAPVREAIRHLEQEGLVEFFPHRGAVVVGLPEAEIDAIYELRAIIEARAMAAVAGKIDDEDIATLERLIDEMRTVLPDKDVGAVADVDLRFHGLIVEWSGLTLLRHIWASLDGLVRVRSYQALDRPGKAARYFLRNAASSHDVLVDAIRSGDPERAAEAARQHVLEVPAMLAGIGDSARPGKGGRGDGRGAR
jgi:DNA-binding GntR family transcriptional regulator